MDHHPRLTAQHFEEPVADAPLGDRLSSFTYKVRTSPRSAPESCRICLHTTDWNEVTWSAACINPPGPAAVTKLS